jgi:hypothetical protein
LFHSLNDKKTPVAKSRAQFSSVARPFIVSAPEKEVLMEFYPPYVESYQQSWAMEFWHKEVLPRAKAAGAANEVLASP